MLKALLLLILVVFGFSNALSVDDDPKWDWRIVGGQNADEGEYPYLVSLRSTLNDHFCGGIILSKRTVLTAAKCVNKRGLSNCVIHAGTHLLSQLGTVYNPERITVHPLYNEFTITHDIAIITTTIDIIFNNVVQPIVLIDEYTYGGEIVVLSGWGTTSYPGNLTTHLQHITLVTLEYEECRDRLINVNPVYPNQICTFTRRGEGACQGDSGGPLVHDDKLIGVVSWGSPCAIGAPDVYTRITAFKTWIEDNIVN